MSNLENDSRIFPFTTTLTLFSCCVNLLFVVASSLLPLNSRAIENSVWFPSVFKTTLPSPSRREEGGGKREFGIMYRPATGEMYYSSLWLLMSFLTIRRTIPLLRTFKCVANFDIRILLRLCISFLSPPSYFSLFISLSNFHKKYISQYKKQLSHTKFYINLFRPADIYINILTFCQVYCMLYKQSRVHTERTILLKYLKI